MTVVNYLISILALAVLVYETWWVIRKNRLIKVKGKDDFFTFCLVLLFASLFFRPDPEADFLVSLRNTLILMAIFFTLAVRRGISEAGIVKLGFVIPWEKVQKIQIAEYQTSKLMAQFTTEKRRFKLIFPKHKLNELVYEIQKHFPQVLLEESLKLSGGK